jgi:tungstate transport system ATP-binding protein
MQDRLLHHRALDRQAAWQPGSRLIGLDRVGYRVAQTAILHDVSLVIPAGAPTMLLGPNGAGKSSLLKLLMGLISPTSGRIASCAGPAFEPLRTGFVFQRPVMLRRSTSANIAYALGAAGYPATGSAIQELLERVSLAHLHARPARHLSSGEQQRLAIARALARRPNLLLLDEPTASLDPASTKCVEDIVAEVSRSGVKVVMATHDLGQARRLGGDVILLVAGRVAERAETADFFQQPRTDAGRRFLAGDLVL